MKNKLIFLILIILFLGSVLFFNTKDYSLEASIDRSILYIGKHTLDSGKFVYKTNPNKNFHIDDDDYNNLRHAGTLYAMYLCEKDLHNNILKEKRLLASDYYVKKYVKPYKNGMYAVVSLAKEEGFSNDFTAKLGAQGLALTALSNLYSENKVDLKILTGIGKFIIFMQNPDGSFNSIYNIKSEEFSRGFSSLYYPGEAALGLLYLYDVDRNDLWLDSAKKALLYLAYSRKDLGNNVPFDHWATIATNKLFKLENNGLTEEEKQILQHHCEQIAYSVINTQIKNPFSPYYGSFPRNPGAASLATYMEGFYAIYCCIENDTLKRKIARSLKIGNEVLMKIQIKQGDLSGGLQNSINIRAKNDSKGQTVRIDNVQHTLTAWINYLSIINHSF